MKADFQTIAGEVMVDVSDETRHARNIDRIKNGFFDILCSEPTTCELDAPHVEHGYVFYKVLKGYKCQRKKIF